LSFHTALVHVRTAREKLCRSTLDGLIPVLVAHEVSSVVEMLMLCW